MTKIDIVSGFLGAGKTTLINRLIKEAYPGEKLVLIENEFGEVGRKMYVDLLSVLKKAFSVKKRNFILLPLHSPLL